MGWFNSPKFFCAFSDILMNMASTIVNILLLITWYDAIFNISNTGPGLSHTLDILTHIYLYINDVILAVQGVPERHFQAFDSTVQSLMWIFPLFPNEANHLVGVKKLIPR